MKFRFIDGIWVSVVVALAVIFSFRECSNRTRISALENSNCQVDTLVLERFPNPTDTLWSDTTIFVRQLIDLTDTAMVGKLRTELAKNRIYWSNRERSLIEAISARDSAIARGLEVVDYLQDLVRNYTLEDSVRTDRYRLWFRASAQGPIDWVTYDVQVFPEVRTVTETKTTAKLNQVMAMVGLQTRPSGVRPIGELGFRRRWWIVQLGYLPASSGAGPEWQISGGASIQF